MAARMAAAFPEPSPGAVRGAAAPQEPPGAISEALSQPPLGSLEGEGTKMSARGLAEPSLRRLTSILKAMAVRRLQARHGGWGMALLFVLGMWAALAAPLLAEAGGHRPPPGYAVYEIIRPKKLLPKVGRPAPGEVSYVVRVEGENHIIHLTQRKGLVVENLPVITYSHHGRRVVEQPHIPDGCHYLGYVEGSPGSLAALSTCAGLRGQLRIGNLSYGIEPVPGSLTFQHLLYRREDTLGKPSMCGLTDVVVRKQPSQRGTKKPLGKQVLADRLKFTRYVEIFVVVDNQLFSFQGRNETSVMLLVIDTINLSETHYYPLRTRICLIGLEIWTRGNYIRYSSDVQEVLTNFNKWEISYLSKKMKYDVAHLFTYSNFGYIVGLAYVGGVCFPGYQTGLSSHIRGDFITFSIIFTHELGHNLGMDHDKKECVCGNAKCYMTGSSVNGASAFSNCSIQNYLDLLSSGNADCLNNIPEPSRLFSSRSCGNKVIDAREQCDCGGPQLCRGDPCCYENCRLRPGAACSVGPCCQKCHLYPSGHKCRSEVDECDLPEYCNGTSEWCPADVHMQDGTPCSDNGYCYRGKCVSLDKQCKKIFGNEARGAPESCFKEQNTKGDRFGNCGGDGTEAPFVQCKPQNALCGRLQCVNVKKISFLEKSETIIQTPGPQDWCWGTAHHASVDTPDIGEGIDGIRCGPTKICINKTCTDAKVITKCDAKISCRGKGVCNNREHCHCNSGWAPPNCWYHGLGGSIDSGPPPSLMLSIAEAVQDKAFGTAVGVTVLIALILIALLIAAIKYRNAILAFFSISSTTETSQTPESDEQSIEEDDRV